MKRLHQLALSPLMLLLGVACQSAPSADSSSDGPGPGTIALFASLPLDLGTDGKETLETSIGSADFDEEADLTGADIRVEFYGSARASGYVGFSSRTFGFDVGDTSVTTIDLGGRLYLAEGEWRPFLGGSIGFGTVDPLPSASLQDWDPAIALKLHAGVDWMISDDFALEAGLALESHFLHAEGVVGGIAIEDSVDLLGASLFLGVGIYL